MSLSIGSRTVRGMVLFLLMGWARSVPAQASGQSGGTHTDPASNPQRPSIVRIGVPQPAPQQFPNSPVLPAGMDSAGGDYPSKYQEESTKPGAPPRHGEFVVAPIPFSNEAFSFGLAPVVEYIFHVDGRDQTSPPSSIVLAGMVATRSTWALGGGGSLYLKHDRFRINAFGGHGTVGYDIFGVGNSGGNQGLTIPIRQGGDLVLLELLVRVKGKFYLGPRFNYRRLSATLDSSATNVTPPAGLDPDDLGAEFTTHAFGFKVLHDTRSDLFYPTKGHKLQFVADFFDATRSSAILPDKDLSYQNYQTSYNHYLSLSPSQVLALRGMFCAVDGNPPFYELCQFGSSSDLRGYQPGRYRDRLMFATQAEYRKMLSRRWGFVLFGGIGEVAHTWDSFTGDDLLPAGGTGIRFNLSKKERINLRADIAYGKTGWSWNFSLGEAF